MSKKESATRRALRVQQIYLKHKAKDLPTEYIYYKFIYPEFFISIRTYYRYLATNAKKEVRKLEETI